MKNGYYYKSNQNHGIDALCDNCEANTAHDYTPWEPIRYVDNEVCSECGLPIHTEDRVCTVHGAGQDLHFTHANTNLVQMFYDAGDVNAINLQPRISYKRR